MPTAMVLWVRRTPHAERRGRFRLSPDDVPSSAVHRCPERDVQLAESLQHADIPVPFFT